MKLTLALTPTKVFVLYVLVILICAALYFCVPGVFKNDSTLENSLYFSVITITTLGYGDLVPVSGWGKLIAGFEALLGVILMGVFLLVFSRQLIEKEERKRIDAAKENLKAQYGAWKHDIIYSLLFLSEPNNSVNPSQPDALTDVNKFREYFKEDDSARWYEIENNLSSKSYYSNEILHGLEAFQQHIETFITICRISDPEVLKQLTMCVNHLRRLRKRDLDDYDDQKGFMGGLWSILAQWDFATGDHERDILLEAIDSV